MDLYSLNFNYQLPGAELIYNASVYDNKQTNTADFSMFPFGIAPLYVGVAPFNFPVNPAVTAGEYDVNDNRLKTHEFRVQSTNPDARIQWVAGLYFNNQDLYTTSQVGAENWGLILEQAPGFNRDTFAADYMCDPGSLADCLPPWLGFYNGNAIDLATQGWDKEKAIFGQMDIKLTERLQATIGLRYSKMAFRLIMESAGMFDSTPMEPVKREDNRSSTNATTPKFGLKWNFDDNSMIYASVAKGVRNGGVNQIITDETCLERLETVWNKSETPRTYGPDQVWSYELGSKFQIARRVNVDMAIYEIRWKDIIRNVGIGGGCIFSFGDNLGSARSRGGELAIQYYPIDSLELSLNAGHARVESTSTIYINDPDAEDGIARDDEGREMYVTRSGAILAGSNTTVNLGAQYSFRAFDRPTYARLDFRYVGSPTKGDAWDPNSSQKLPDNQLFETPKLKTLNFRLGTKLDNLDLSLYVNNVTNTQPILKFRPDGFSVSGDEAWMMGSVMTRPREMGVTAVYRY